MPQRPHVPTSLETERLILRAPELSDVPFMYGAIKESIKELEPWMPWATKDYTIEACEENRNRQIHHERRFSDVLFRQSDRTTYRE
ncbi:MAG: hypothetical protein ACRCYY_10960 [Trueperaceae bacterium]